MRKVKTRVMSSLRLANATLSLLYLLENLGIQSISHEIEDLRYSIDRDICELCEFNFDYCTCSDSYYGKYMREYDDEASLDDY